MQVLSRFYGAAILAVMALLGAGAAWAGVGQPSDWQIGPQEAVTPVADQIVGFHTYLLIVISVITAFVLATLRAIFAMYFLIYINMI